MRRLAGLLIGGLLLILPGQALAALAFTSPTPSTTLRANQTLAIGWTADADGYANDTSRSYLKFTNNGTAATITMYLAASVITAHGISFRPDQLRSDFATAHPGDVTFGPDGSTTMLPGGTYLLEIYTRQANGTVQATSSVTNLVIQSQCTPGSYSGDGWPPCAVADAGHYAPGTGATSQLLCPAGTFNGNVQSASCFDVPPGTYAPTDGSIAPTDCERGTYQDEAGKTSCKISPAGRFVAVTGAVSATPCPDGTTSPAGSTSDTACVAPAAPTTEARGDTTAPAPASTACTVGLRAAVTAACVARQLGISIARPVVSRLVLPSGKQASCSVRRHRILGTAGGTCRVVLVVAKPGSMAKTYRATVTISA